MGGKITGPLIMIANSGGGGQRPFARLNLKMDFHKITIPAAGEGLGMRVFAHEIRNLSIRGEREQGITVFKSGGSTIMIMVDSGHSMQVNALGFEKGKTITVVLNPDCELFPDASPIQKGEKISRRKLGSAIFFGSGEVTVSESMEIYVSGE
jgi:hypothetical protein